MPARGRGRSHAGRRGVCVRRVADRPGGDRRGELAGPAGITVPYKDCLTYIKLRVDRVREGQYRDNQVIAVFWGMKDNIRQPAADYSGGGRFR